MHGKRNHAGIRVRHGRAPALDRERIVNAPLQVPLPPGETEWPLALFSPEGDLIALARARDEDPAPAVRLLRVFA